MPAKKKGPSGKDVPTWMEFVLAIWEKRFPGCLPPKGTATALSPVFGALSEEEACNRLRRYLGDTPAKYVNLMKFAATDSSYSEQEYTHPSPAPKRGTGGSILLSEVVRAVKFEPHPEVAVEVDPATGRLRRKN